MIQTSYDAVVFDNDGVLIELTERELLRDAIHDTFAEFDVTVEDDLVREMAARDQPPESAFADRHGINPDAFWKRRETNACAAQCEAIRSGEKVLYDDVSALAELEQSLAVVSNNQHETVEFVLAHHELDRQFDAVYGREPTLAGARRKKPDPSYIHDAIADLGASSALYVGDSEKDVVAADRAGIDSAFLRREHRHDLTLSREPTYEFPDLHALVDALHSSAE